MNKDSHDIDAQGFDPRGGNDAMAETGRDADGRVADGRGVVSAVAAREGADDAGSGEALR